MNAQELADKIVEIVNRLGDATHGTLIVHTEPGTIDGDLSLENREMNVVLAVGVNELFADAFLILQREKPQRVVFDATDALISAIDGTPMPGNMPLARKPPKHGYKEPHFAPFILRKVSA